MNARDAAPARDLPREALVAAQTVIGDAFPKTAAVIAQALDALDPDYSPAYQDEYQRLWHEAAADRDRYKAALEEILDMPTNATVLNVHFIAKEALSNASRS